MVDADLIAPEQRRPLKRAEYERLVALGAFDGERVELLHGTLIQMSPHDPPHAVPIQVLTARLVAALGTRAIVRVQLPLVAAGESEPEPDLAVVPLGDYRTQHPSTAHLVIEVADSSLRKDREVKAPLYAASGFPEYWIVNVPDQVVEIHRSPAAGRYQRVARHGASDTVTIEAFADVAIPVADLFR